MVLATKLYNDLDQDFVPKIGVQNFSKIDKNVWSLSWSPGHTTYPLTQERFLYSLSKVMSLTLLAYPISGKIEILRSIYLYAIPANHSIRSNKPTSLIAFKVQYFLLPKPLTRTHHLPSPSPTRTESAWINTQLNKYETLKAKETKLLLTNTGRWFLIATQTFPSTAFYNTLLHRQINVRWQY